MHSGFTLWFLRVAGITHHKFIAEAGEGFCCNVSFNIRLKWDGPQEMLDISVWEQWR